MDLLPHHIDFRVSINRIDLRCVKGRQSLMEIRVGVARIFLISFAQVISYNFRDCWWSGDWHVHIALGGHHCDIILALITMSLNYLLVKEVAACHILLANLCLVSSSSNTEVQISCSLEIHSILIISCELGCLTD